MEKCPHCGGTEFIRGFMHQLAKPSQNVHVRFFPMKSKLFNEGIPIQTFVCKECGYTALFTFLD